MTEFDLEWRKNPFQEINNVLGKELIRIYVTESEFAVTVVESKTKPKLIDTKLSEWYLSGLDLEFIEGYLSI